MSVANPIVSVHTERKGKRFLRHMGSDGDSDLRFCSPQTDTSLRFKTLPGLWIVCRTVCMFTFQPLLVFTAPTHNRDGWAELTRVAGYFQKQFTCTQMVTHSSANRA